jgi:hypothetical protein
MEEGYTRGKMQEGAHEGKKKAGCSVEHCEFVELYIFSNALKFGARISQ